MVVFATMPLLERFSVEQTRVIPFSRMSQQPPPPADPQLCVSDAEYLADCAWIPRASIANLQELDIEEMSRWTETDLPRGNLLSLAVLPFTGGCRDPRKEDGQTLRQFVENEGFLFALTVDPTSHLTRFNLRMGYFFDLLPPALRCSIDAGGCTFALEYPEPPFGAGNIGWLVSRHAAALQNLKRLHGCV